MMDSPTVQYKHILLGVKAYFAILSSSPLLVTKNSPYFDSIDKSLSPDKPNETNTMELFLLAAVGQVFFVF